MMGWRGLVVNAVPAPFQPTYRQNLEDSMLTSEQFWHWYHMTSTRLLHVILRLLKWQNQFDYEFERIFQELQWCLGEGESLVAALNISFIAQQLEFNIIHFIFVRSQTYGCRFGPCFPPWVTKFFQLCHLKNAESNSNPAYLPLSVSVQHNAGHTSHNQVQPQERCCYACRMSVPVHFLFPHFLLIWLQSSPARMHNLVLHLQAQCLCLQPHQRGHKRQELLWEEFYTKAIYSAKCSLIADNYDLGQCFMAAFERGDTWVSSVP